MKVEDKKAHRYEWQIKVRSFMMRDGKQNRALLGTGLLWFRIEPYLELGYYGSGYSLTWNWAIMVQNIALLGTGLLWFRI